MPQPQPKRTTNVMRNNNNNNAAVRTYPDAVRPRQIMLLAAAAAQNHNDDNHNMEEDETTVRWKVSPPPPPSKAAAITTVSQWTSANNNNNNNKQVSVSSSFNPSRTLRIQRFARLPVWPVWMGVMLWAISIFLGKETASQLETFTGGRVCPMALVEHNNTSPFLLLVHHHHRFPWWDGLGRALTKQFLPAEGFPAHPHRGFTTLTYMLQGGFVHRDSMGVKQEYGSDGMLAAVQWLFTGAGVLHEEMFLNQKQWSENVHELYQLWINVPSWNKLDPPDTKLLSFGNNNDANADMPIITTSHVSQQQNNDDNASPPPQCITSKSTVRVLAGAYREQNNGKLYQSTAPTMSDLQVLHCTISTSRNRRSERKVSSVEPPNNRFAITSPPIGWTYDVPQGYDSVVVYVRKGNCRMEFASTCVTTNGQIATTAVASDTKRVPIHSIVCLEPSMIQQQNGKVVKETLTIVPEHIGGTVDVLVLAGVPLYERYGSDNGMATTTLEPVAMQGSMVMNYKHEIEQAYRDYQLGKMGRPWSEQLSDEEWRRHVQKYPNQYGCSNQRASRMQASSNPNETVDYKYLDDDFLGKKQ